MAARLSTALVTKLMDTGSFKDIFANCVIDVYSGTQPTTADAAATGLLLVSVTKASAAFTAETRAVGSVTLTGGASGSVNTVTVNSLDILGSAVAYNTSLAQTATDVAAAINNNPKNLQFVASASGAIVTITAVNGLGTLPNTWVVSATLTTITATYVNMTGGVAAANGLTFGSAAAGVLSKAAGETWSGVAVGAGTAGWFRIRGSGDAGTALDSAGIYPRFDGSISTSGAQMNLGSLTVVIDAPFIISAASFSLPTA